VETAEILREMQAHLEEGWTKNALVHFLAFGGETVTMVCLQGACLVARYGVKEWEEENDIEYWLAENQLVADALAAVIREQYPERLPGCYASSALPSWSYVIFFNDSEHTTFEDVMSVVGKAIVNEEARVDA